MLIRFQKQLFRNGCFLFRSEKRKNSFMENSKEVQSIKDVIQTYVSGYLNAESDQVAHAFHAETRLFCVDEEKLEKTTLADWLSGIKERKAKADRRFGSHEVLNLDIINDAAIAKIAISLPKFKFTDYLSLLKIENRWQIIGKIYSVEVL